MWEIRMRMMHGVGLEGRDEWTGAWSWSIQVRTGSRGSDEWTQAGIAGEERT